MGNMIARVLLAVLGAIIVTGSLLLGMDTVTSIFRDRDNTRYYRISNTVPLTDPGRPERPAPAQRQPGAPQTEIDLPAGRVEIEAPTEIDPSVSAPVLAPRLDRSDSTIPDN
jgi:hypothetical protein